MRTAMVLSALALLLTSATTTEAASLPWSTVSELEDRVTGASVALGCGDSRPMGLYVVTQGSEEYHLVVNADARWAIIGPPDAGGQIAIWYGSFTSGDRVLVERVVVGTPQTDICPLLASRTT